MRMFRIIIFFMMFLAVSCMKEDIREPYVVSEEVRVALEMSVAGELPRTKEIIDPDITDATVVQDVIKNFWILQYDGTADGSLLVGEPEYYPDMDEFLKPESEGGDGGKVRLVRSAGNNKNRIVILANTFDPMMLRDTFHRQAVISIYSSTALLRFPSMKAVRSVAVSKEMWRNSRLLSGILLKTLR